MSGGEIDRVRGKGREDECHGVRASGGGDVVAQQQQQAGGVAGRCLRVAAMQGRLRPAGGIRRAAAPFAAAEARLVHVAFFASVCVCVCVGLFNLPSGFRD